MINYFLSMISAFTIFQSCSFIDTDKTQIISAIEFDKSKNVAIKKAFKKAIIKIDEVGCNQDKGKGNVTYKRSGSGYVAEARYIIPRKYCYANPACKDQEWVNQETRSQGGGWVWFLGSGVAKSRYDADNLAKTEALNHLAAECDTKNSLYRFVERCEEYLRESFVVYTRASIHQNDCIKN